MNKNDEITFLEIASTKKWREFSLSIEKEKSETDSQCGFIFSYFMNVFIISPQSLSILHFILRYNFSYFQFVNRDFPFVFYFKNRTKYPKWLCNCWTMFYFRYLERETKNEWEIKKKKNTRNIYTFIFGILKKSLLVHKEN